MKFEFNGHSCVTRIVNSLLMSSNTSREGFLYSVLARKKKKGKIIILLALILNLG